MFALMETLAGLEGRHYENNMNKYIWKFSLNYESYFFHCLFHFVIIEKTKLMVSNFTYLAGADFCRQTML